MREYNFYWIKLIDDNNWLSKGFKVRETCINVLLISLTSLYFCPHPSQRPGSTSKVNMQRVQAPSEFWSGFWLLIPVSESLFPFQEINVLKILAAAFLLSFFDVLSQISPNEVVLNKHAASHRCVAENKRLRVKERNGERGKEKDENEKGQ